MFAHASPTDAWKIGTNKSIESREQFKITMRVEDTVKSTAIGIFRLSLLFENSH